MDKSWIKMNRTSAQYIGGVQAFLDFAFANARNSKLIVCPCNHCKLGRNRWFNRDKVTEHLMFNGFCPAYTEWVHHGEPISTQGSSTPHIPSHTNINNDANFAGNMDTGALLSDLFGICNQGNNQNTHDTDSCSVMDPLLGIDDDLFAVDDDFINELNNYGVMDEDENFEEVGYKKVLEQAHLELYPGSSYSKLSFMLHLFHLKSMHGWSIKSFDKLLQLLGVVFPQIKPFPTSWSQCNELKRDLGLHYEKIHACLNDCILYWDGRENLNECDKCGASRWKDENKKVPHKVLRYFPLIPRLLRMYKSSKTAEDMLWHHKDRVKDGKLRHPADAEAWKHFDRMNPDFASDPRNVRFGLATDGFNPFRVMSTNHSTWPVLLIPYNMPPWLCMKQHSIILSMIIPGEKAPGMDIDVYLQPLIKELLQLWSGVDAFDAYTKTRFKLGAALHSTTSDFPAYANLSGWSTKGRLACPSCAKDTHSFWMENGHKFCYMGHRRWLPKNHAFRFDDVGFDGNVEFGDAPKCCSGTDILAQLQGTTFTYGKGDFQNVDIDEKDEEQIWKKRSIFFTLPYWEHNLLRHNLDVMHIEKNICDNFLGTFLNLEGKSKDNLKARKDLQLLKIKPNLHPILLPNGKYEIPEAPYTLSAEEKTRLLIMLKRVRFPDGYASNISCCVNLKERKLFNLKSHDCHILMHDLLPIVLRAAKDTNVVDIMCELSDFFEELCGKELSLEKLDDIKANVAITLCKMEKIFPPHFFTIMVHLIIHLPDEAKLGGPVFYRWMYPIERFLAFLKGLVHNRAQPEGSIAEGYIAHECITFCSRYFGEVETVFNRPQRNEGSHINKDIYLFSTAGEPKGKVEMVKIPEINFQQAQRYVLLHLDGIDEYHRQFLNERMESHPRLVTDRIKHKWFVEGFSTWIKQKVSDMDAQDLKSRVFKVVASGAHPIVKRMNGFVINGCRFHTQRRDKKNKTQNFGVMVEVGGKAYFGKINDIIELDYYSEYKVVLFRCDWVNVNARGVKTDKRGFKLLNFAHKIHEGAVLKDDPYILSSQAKQVFYVEDERDKGWEHVIHAKPRDTYQLGSLEDDDEL